MKRIAVLGSTGSVGVSALAVAGSLGDRIEVEGLSANSNMDLLADQIRLHRPRAVAVGDETAARRIRALTEGIDLDVFSGKQGLVRIAELEDIDLVVNSVVGAAGVVPTLAAIGAGRDIAIANKESLVAAGEIIVRKAAGKGVKLLPVDSEHSAIHQCLKGERPDRVRRVILTASGGPLVGMSREELAGVKASDALRHPTWNMGRKVTIDSATLMNKGFEVIEAHWLFGIDADNIDVVVERKSIVHSLVEFVDGSVIAMLSKPDMRLPIQYALTYPDRVDARIEMLDIEAMGEVRFEKPDHERFPCLRLAYRAAREGGTVPAVLSAADEVAVEAFLEDRITFGEIHSTLTDVIDRHTPGDASSLEAVLEADSWARHEAEAIIGKMVGRR
jgi:1-deoxy-D-xylulose-5-phosphate reductoisomerase